MSATTSVTLEPFRIDVAQRDVDDLRRLRDTRWPDQIPSSGWTSRDLAAYWADGYDWRRHEAQLDELR